MRDRNSKGLQETGGIVSEDETQGMELRRRSFRKLLKSWVDGVTEEEKVESVVDEMFLYKSSLCIYRTHP